MLDNRKNSFVQYVELHERAWGMDSYAGRPSLQQLLNAPVVAFWYLTGQRETRYLASLHRDVSEFNEYVSSLLLNDGKLKTPERRLTKLFVNRKEVTIKGIKLILSE